MHKSFFIAALAAAVFTPAAASAELRRVQFKVDGMSCAYCNTTMSAAIQKLDGVEKVRLSAEEGLVIVELKAGNKIAIEQLRRLVRSNGYPTKDAEIVAIGKVVNTGGAHSLDLLNGSMLALTAPPSKSVQEVVEVKGVVTADDKNAERLRITSMAPAPR